MSRTFVTVVVALLFVLTFVTIVSSFGFYLSIFTIVLIPAIIIHLYAMVKAHRAHPVYNVWILLSALAFFGFSLMRPDTDVLGQFSGYNALGYMIGIVEKKNIAPSPFALEISLGLILLQILINTYILIGFGKIPK